jgi:hypothetical protein
MLKKQTLLHIRNAYTTNAFQAGSGMYIGAGSETEPEGYLYDAETGSSSKVEGCPGGMMSFVPVPGHPDHFVSIMGLFPPFIGKEAGLFLHIRKEKGWETRKVLDLPFAHRCEFLRSPDGVFLVLASVSRYKEDPADWSQPGETHVIRLDGIPRGEWKTEVVDSATFRNHGMTRTQIDGKETVCISGAEGIFALDRSDSGRWSLRKQFHKEVSEMVFIDLDGDGIHELVTIEPFHGDTLNIYKKQNGEWDLTFSDTLSFGHGLSGGNFNALPVIVAGNRRDSLALELFTISDLAAGRVDRKVIEENAGPTQTQVFSFRSKDCILSANQRKHEVALYTGTID